MSDKNTTCCFTGHRDIAQSEYEAISAAILNTVQLLYEKGFRHFICGGAVGFDTIAAVTLLNCKRLFPALRLVIARPCPEQSDKWPLASRALYARILERADEVVTLSPHYTKSCMLERNRYMVDRSALLVAYVRSESGGSAYTRRYAEKKGLTVINLASTVG